MPGRSTICRIRRLWTFNPKKVGGTLKGPFCALTVGVPKISFGDFLYESWPFRKKGTETVTLGNGDNFDPTALFAEFLTSVARCIFRVSRFYPRQLEAMTKLLIDFECRGRLYLGDCTNGGTSLVLCVLDGRLCWERESHTSASTPPLPGRLSALETQDGVSAI